MSVQQSYLVEGLCSAPQPIGHSGTAPSTLLICCSISKLYSVAEAACLLLQLAGKWHTLPTHQHHPTGTDTRSCLLGVAIACTKCDSGAQAQMLYSVNFATLLCFTCDTASHVKQCLVTHKSTALCVHLQLPSTAQTEPMTPHHSTRCGVWVLHCGQWILRCPGDSVHIDTSSQLEPLDNI